MADTVVHLHSVNAPEIPANDAVFSRGTQEAVTHIVAAAEARAKFANAAKGANNIFALVGDLVAHLWIHIWVNPNDASTLINLRNAANEDSSALQEERNAV